MKLRTKIAMGTLGFLMAALFLCCSLLIATGKKALLDNAIDYTSQEEEKLAAAVSSHENELSEIEMKLTASTVLKYYFFQEMQSAAAGSEYTLQSGDEILFNNSGINAAAALGIDNDSISKEITMQIFHFQEGDYCIAGKSIILCGQVYQICVVRNITELFSQINRLIWECIVIGLIISILACGMIILFLKKTLTPLEHLKTEAEAIASGKYDRRLVIPGRDELAALAVSFNAMAESVEQHVKEVEETSEARNQLIHALAHEMRTPVTAICGYSYALKSVKMNTEQKAEAIDFIDMEARRLERLSGRLTNLVGLANNQIEWKEIDLSAWEIQLTRIFRNSAAVSIVVDKDGIIYGDQDLLTMLLTNLCDNAEKAGATEIIITINSEMIQVKDNGSGIPKDQIGKIFQAFYQGDASRNQSGFGLGLALCQKIAEIHGTTLVVESEEGKGSCFTMHLYNSFTSL